MGHGIMFVLTSTPVFGYGWAFTVWSSVFYPSARLVRVDLQPIYFTFQGSNQFLALKQQVSFTSPTSAQRSIRLCSASDLIMHVIVVEGDMKCKLVTLLPYSKTELENGCSKVERGYVEWDNGIGLLGLMCVSWSEYCRGEREIA